MSSYTPYYICPHCDTVVEAAVTLGTTHGGLASGHQPMCGCKDSLKSWETQHRAEMERRKQFRKSSK